MPAEVAPLPYRAEDDWAARPAPEAGVAELVWDGDVSLLQPVRTRGCQ
jgi:hypothetical protein